MTSPAPLRLDRTLHLADADATAAFAARLAPALQAGDCILLSGPIGAGKTHFCRSLIQARLVNLGRFEDVPSPTFTLVQVYDAGDVALWHTDLYRLTGADEVLELGLDEAFDEAICLVEWPDRLGSSTPANALSLTLRPDGDGESRTAHLSSTSERWADLINAYGASDA